MNKKILFFICLTVFTVSVANVSASEDFSQTNVGDTSNLDNNGDVLSISSSEDEIVGANGDTFTELQNMINAAGIGDTINLSTNYTYDSGFAGFGIEINNPITINGNGNTIDGLNTLRIFQIKATSGVILNNITFKNGYSDDNSGGAIVILNKLSNSTFKDLKFIDNVAKKNGGAVYFLEESSNNLFENIIFENNIAQTEDGGAINFFGKITDTTFNNVTFCNNRDFSVGGAINIDSGMENCLFNNSAFINNSGNMGGALSITGVNKLNVFENTKFINNTARTGDGGAINVGTYGSSNLDNNKFKNVTFINNTANKNGGALYVKGESLSNTFEDTIFAGNTAKIVDGGAINFFGKITDTSFNNVTFCNNRDFSAGGAINIDSGMENCLFNNSVFINNSGNMGGALSITGVNKLNVFENTKFINNTAQTADGGAINVGTYASSNLNSTKFKNVTFINNTANNNGGALYVNGDSSNNSIQDSIFINNNENKIYLSSGNITMINNWFGNNATNYMNEPDVNVTMNSWLFLNATADPKEITLNETSNIAFKLYSYDGNAISEYYGPLNVILELYSTLGLLNQTVALTGEEVLYTPSKCGNSSITGKFENAYYTITLENNKIPTEINVINDTVNMTINDEVASGATLIPADAGNLTYTSSNETVAIVENGKIKALAEGAATITVSFAGNDKYTPAENKTVTVNVSDKPAPKKDLNISGSAEPITVGENATIIVIGFENATGDVSARIEGGLLSTSIVNGTATFTVPGLTSSTTAYISYEGDDNYNAANATVDITVYPKSDVVIVAENVTKYYGGPERFVANIYDSELNPMVNKSVNITINGVTYTKTTDDNGTVSLAINLGSGTYDVTTKVDNTTLKSSVCVLSTVSGSNLTKYYRNGTQYSVKVYNTNGTVVGKGEVVTFNINGIFYNRTTDENGIATLNINLPPSEYIVTADYKGCKVANNITVLPVLNASDITMKYLDGNQFKVNLVDGQGNPYKDQFVRFNINGKFYDRLTDSNGQAALNIRLPPGEYIITSSFNGANIANKITITG